MFQLIIPFQLEFPFSESRAERRRGCRRRARPVDDAELLLAFGFADRRVGERRGALLGCARS